MVESANTKLVYKAKFLEQVCLQLNNDKSEFTQIFSDLCPDGNQGLLLYPLAMEFDIFK